MLEPVGPLPTVVYWRRRAAALVAAILTVVLLSWPLTRLVDQDSDVRSAAQSGELSASPSPAPEPPGPTAAEVPPVPQLPTLSPEFPAPNPPEVPTVPSPPMVTAEPQSSIAPVLPAPAVPAPVPVPPAPVPVPPALVPAEPAPTEPGTPAPPVATTGDPAPTSGAPTSTPTPGACADTALSVSAQVGAASYPVGEQPVFRILIANTGPTPCVRDLDAARQSVTVYTVDDELRSWSSNDCFPAAPTDEGTVVLDPGAVATFNVKWSGTTSEPACATERSPAQAGEYTVVSTLDEIVSAPAEFELTQP